PGQALEAMAVVMHEGQTAPMAVMKDKCRTVHTARDAECLGEPLDPLPVSGPELSLQRDDVTRLLDEPQAASNLPGLIHRRRANGSGHSLLPDSGWKRAGRRPAPGCRPPVSGSR